MSSSSATKRCLEKAFEDQNENDENNKRLNSSLPVPSPHFQIKTKINHSLNKFDMHMFEAEVKSNVARIASLEQDLRTESTAKTRAELELKAYKNKQAFEMQNVQERNNRLQAMLEEALGSKQILSKELLDLKQNTMTNTNDSQNSNSRAVSQLQEQLKKSNEELNETKTQYAKQITDLKYDKEAGELEISKLKNTIENLEESMRGHQELKKKLEEQRKEISILQNKCKDLEVENFNASLGNSNTKKSLIESAKESQRTNDLERENRKLKDQVEYLRACQEKAHLYQEEVRSKTKQCERYETKLLEQDLKKAQLDSEIFNLKEEILELQNGPDANKRLTDCVNETSSQLEHWKSKAGIFEEDIRSLKSKKDQKEKELEELRKRVARLNVERNGYQSIISIYDSERREFGFNSESETKCLYKRVEQMELILSQYKANLSDTNQLKLCNNSTFQLQEENKTRCAGTQVNLSGEIYAEYELRIRNLKNQLEEKAQEQRQEDSVPLFL